MMKSYQRISRKQCNIIYSAFKKGDLVPPKAANGRQKRAGFIYDYEGAGLRSRGSSMILYNAQLEAICQVVGYILDQEYKKAQNLLDGKDEDFNYNFLPEDFPPRKMWKIVF